LANSGDMGRDFTALSLEFADMVSLNLSGLGSSDDCSVLLITLEEVKERHQSVCYVIEDIDKLNMNAINK